MIERFVTGAADPRRLVHGRLDQPFSRPGISCETRPDIAPAGMVLIAPAVDFTERLMWDRFPEELRRSVQETGVYHRPSAYSDEPYPITWELIEDGRRHLLLGQPIQTGCPVHILQGMEDPTCPGATRCSSSSTCRATTSRSP